MGRLDGKVAVITAATGGIGEFAAQRFIAEGANVVVSGRNQEKGFGRLDRLFNNAGAIIGAPGAADVTGSEIDIHFRPLVCAPISSARAGATQ